METFFTNDSWDVISFFDGDGLVNHTFLHIIVTHFNFTNHRKIFSE